MSTPDPDRIDLLGVLLMLVSAVSFGALGILVTIAVSDGADNLGLLLIRFWLAGIVLLVIHRALRRAWPPRQRWGGLVAMGAVGYTLQALCYFYAVEFASPGLVALLLYVFPFFVMLLSRVFLHEPIRPVAILALVMCVAGAGLTVQGGTGTLPGIILALTSALVYSIYIVAGSRFTAGIEPLTSSLIILLSSAAAMTTVIVLRMVMLDAPAPSWPESVIGWSAALGIALICTVLAVLCFFAGLARLGPTRSALLSTAEPVATVLMAAWLLSQPLAPAQLLGGGLILAAGILLVRGKSASNAG